jgi:methylated-DNA-[protein]-cysteine S-methyltransferase
MGYSIFDTAIGPCGIAWNDNGITAFQLPEEDVAATEKRLAAKSPNQKKGNPPSKIKAAIAQVQKHFDGKPQTFADVPIDFSAIDGFDAEVYRALRKVPPGQTITYGELAKATSKPGGARAVGRAMATNPIPVIIACHRVFAAGGKLHGFSAYGGIVTKQRILELEGWKDPAVVGTLFEKKPDLPFDHAKALAHLRAADKTMAKHIDSVKFAFTLKDTEGVFAALAEAIVYQQLHGKAAATIFGRVKALFPKGKLDPQLVVGSGAEPQVTEADLRKAGLSANKYKALKDLAERSVRGEVPTLTQLQRMDDETIIEALTKVRGIGRWTVEMLLMFRLGRPDVFPVADFGIRKGFARLYHPKAKRDEMPDVAAMTKRAEKWKPYRSIASWYLWRATELE